MIKKIQEFKRHVLEFIVLACDCAVKLHNNNTRRHIEISQAQVGTRNYDIWLLNFSLSISSENTFTVGVALESTYLEKFNIKFALISL